MNGFFFFNRIPSEFCQIYTKRCLFAQVVGAAWYLLSVDRYTSCWKQLCKKDFDPKCSLYLDCDTFDHNDRKTWANVTDVFKNCDPRKEIDFQFGIFESAVKKNAVSKGFLEKYFYCLWWGLQQLR